MVIQQGVWWIQAVSATTHRGAFESRSMLCEAGGAGYPVSEAFGAGGGSRDLSAELSPSNRKGICVAAENSPAVAVQSPRIFVAESSLTA